MKTNEPTVLKIREHVVEFKREVPEISVMVTGDWHISPIVSSRQAEFLQEAVDVVKPDVIVLQGDIVDSPMELQRDTSLKKLIRELKICSKAAPTMMVLGSHDFITPSKPIKIMKDSALDFWKKICKKCDVKLLINEPFEPIPGVVFYGMFQDERCIIGLDKNGRYDHYNRPEGFLECLDELSIEPDPAKVNWFVAHAPLLSKDAVSKLSDFDIASFGHTHGGIVPRGLDDLFERLGINHGLIYTDLKPFPSFVRGVKIFNNGTLMLINPGMTGAQFCAPKFAQNLNFVKAAEVSVVKIKTKK